MTISQIASTVFPGFWVIILYMGSTSSDSVSSSSAMTDKGLFFAHFSGLKKFVPQALLPLLSLLLFQPAFSFLFLPLSAPLPLLFPLPPSFLLSASGQILPSAQEFEASLDEAQKWAVSVEYNESDVNDIVKSIRKKKRV